jgi:hypothetical protein
VAARLVRRLGAATIAARDDAERRLVELGPRALPQVVAARRAATAEAAFRLEAIQRHLEAVAAERSIEPATVTLAARALPVRDVLTDLFAQAGSRIDLAPEVGTGPAGARPVTVAITRGTFWESLDAVLEGSGLQLSFADAPPGLAIAPADAAGGSKSRPAVAAGPLRISVAGVEPVGPPPADGGGRGARVTLRVAWEPRLAPLVMRLPARSLVAEGPGGEAVPPAQRAATIEPLIPSRRQWLDIPVVLTAPAVPLESLGMLRGTMLVWLAGMEHDFSFADVRVTAGGLPTDDDTAREPARMARAEVRLLAASQQDRRLLVRARVSYDTPSEPLASHHGWLGARPLEAFAGDGRPLERIDQQVTGRSDRGLTTTAEFALPAAGGGPDGTAARGVSIRWKLPIDLHEVPVDFALRGVALPAASGR